MGSAESGLFPGLPEAVCPTRNNITKRIRVGFLLFIWVYDYEQAYQIGYSKAT
jgi:hypothetical protein